MDKSVERIVIETDLYRIVGDITHPGEGYRARLSDELNRADGDFIALTDVELSPLGGSSNGPQRMPFVAVSRRAAHLIYPLA
jgi:hypothetical protein